ncbi:unnamed protein product, partial [marine sediment metagenome]
SAKVHGISTERANKEGVPLKYVKIHQVRGYK